LGGQRKISDHSVIAMAETPRTGAHSSGW
jgi:hypothetical protein